MDDRSRPLLNGTQLRVQLEFSLPQATKATLVLSALLNEILWFRLNVLSSLIFRLRGSNQADLPFRSLLTNKST